MANPWLKFYTSDWRSDPRLKMCSMAARGLWVEMICLMHEATPYGHLLVNGHSPTDAQLAVLVGAPPDQITALLGELEAAGVFSRTRAGVIYSRKLTRMTKKAATARNNGRKGGNPSLGKEKEKSASVNPQDKGGVKPQKPESRIQNYTDAYASDGGAVDMRDAVWKRGVPFLCKTGVTEKQARSMIGKWLKDATPADVFNALSEAAKARTEDPIPYITEALKPEESWRERNDRLWDSL